MNAQRQQFLLFRIRTFKDRKAFGELYKEYAESMSRFLRSKLPTQEDADDIRTKTFLRLWNYVTVSHVDHLSGLIFTIARGCIAEFYYKRKTEEPLDAAVTEGKEPVSSDSKEKMVAKTELELLKRMIERLPEPARDAVWMRYFEDLPFDEIARRIDKSSSATRMMVHRAMKTLRALLKEKDV